MKRYPEHAAWKRRAWLLLPNPLTLLRALPLPWPDARRDAPPLARS